VKNILRKEQKDMLNYLSSSNKPTKFRMFHISGIESGRLFKVFLKLCDEEG
jgi:hypothetical protein